MLSGFTHPRNDLQELSLSELRVAAGEIAIGPRRALFVRLVSIALLAAGCVLLFVGRQPEGALQWQRELWNFGHIALFAGLSAVLLQRWRAPLRRQLPLLFVGSAAIGFVVEVIQRQIGRDFSLRDVLLDVVGSAVGAWLVVRLRVTRQQRWLLALPVLVAVAAVSLPFVAIAWDSVQAARQFPRFATFESRGELRRFQFYGGASGEVRDGALQLQFGTAEWSGFTLFEPASDWRGYRSLLIEVVNPALAPLDLICRVDDRLHRFSNFDYHDRFNRRFRLEPGSNQLRIALADIEAAPRGRLMAMEQIDALGCFVHRESALRTLQLRVLRLE